MRSLCCRFCGEALKEGSEWWGVFVGSRLLYIEPSYEQAKSLVNDFIRACSHDAKVMPVLVFLEPERGEPKAKDFGEET